MVAPHVMSTRHRAPCDCETSHPDTSPQTTAVGLLMGDVTGTRLDRRGPWVLVLGGLCD